ncbi:carboxypeptidase-like regulatory domain-containing protein [Gilvimarinus agarilyticus]|uniref:carboxypeptidase-like regulatory domain-containing protein n=1 Tax=Reichenbachiella agariperforans TaxID=156994 RepID=UPI001C0A3E4B|nr:carboxypeptidase-like regulatory domain-containing protein [Reichenbachiella agariperforans]MBU2884887.1 carboxypeptidase-like regulatory domain-containing protein [Gilvimarinus agarilyticus]MBU2914986.1 carboxypeptidase-like regulatory domain-containing protein [Reichenbachiella agariperforans]
MKQILLLTCLLLFSFFLVFAQKDQSKSFQLLDANTSMPVPYAHIIHEDRLIAMTDYYGNFKLKLNGTEGQYLVSCIGYENLIFNITRLSGHSFEKLWIKPSERLLGEVTISPTSLQDMIAEVYDNIPKAYTSTPHLLIGVLHEKYTDTTGHVHISSEALLQVQKLDYKSQRNRGDVKIDSLSKKYDVKDTLYSKIYAGAHIPHRFDFVMRKEDFINPNGFDKYDYSYLGEWESNNQKLTVIGFEPKTMGPMNGQFRGEMYIDFDQKVFVKAEYEYSRMGFMSNPLSRWADKRTFISIYEQSSDGWYLSSTWDEAVRSKDNFVLSQFYETKQVHFDTMTHWTYDEKIHLQEAVAEQKADTIIAESKSKDHIKTVGYDRGRKFNWLDRIEVGYGLKYYLFNTYTLSSVGSTTYNSQNFNVTDTFDIKKGYLNLLTTIRYRLLPNFLLTFNAAGSFNEVVRNESMDLGILYLFDLKTSRPSYISTSIAYAHYKNLLMYEEINQTTPIYEKKERGIQLGIGYEFRLNPNWKLALSYKNFVSLNEGERYYLQEKYGFMNLLKKKHNYPKKEIIWVNDENSINAIPQLFKSHSFDISFIFSVK